MIEMVGHVPAYSSALQFETGFVSKNSTALSYLIFQSHRLCLFLSSGDGVVNFCRRVTMKGRNECDAQVLTIKYSQIEVKMLLIMF